jgi:hypothetical protein
MAEAIVFAVPGTIRLHICEQGSGYGCLSPYEELYRGLLDLD